MTEKRISGEKVFSGKLIDVYHDQVELPDGKHSLREVCAHGGAVAVVARQGEELLLVRQYRYAAQRELLEIPAGKLEPGEDPAEAARRELREETGAVCREFVPLGEIFTSPGILSERIYLYYAGDLTQVGQQLDEGEFLDVEPVPLNGLDEMIAGGQITDAKTLSGIAMARAAGFLHTESR